MVIITSHKNRNLFLPPKFRFSFQKYYKKILIFFVLIVSIVYCFFFINFELYYQNKVKSVIQKKASKYFNIKRWNSSWFFLFDVNTNSQVWTTRPISHMNLLYLYAGPLILRWSGTICTLVFYSAFDVILQIMRKDVASEVFLYWILRVILNKVYLVCALQFSFCLLSTFNI